MNEEKQEIFKEFLEEIESLEKYINNLYFEASNIDEISLLKKEIITKKIALLSEKIEGMLISYSYIISDNESALENLCNDIDKQVKIRDFLISLVMVSVLILNRRLFEYVIPKLAIGLTVFFSINNYVLEKEYDELEDNIKEFEKLPIEERLNKLKITLQNTDTFLKQYNQKQYKSVEEKIVITEENLIEKQKYFANLFLLTYIKTKYKINIPLEYEDNVLKLLQKELNVESDNIDDMLDMIDERDSLENIKHDMNLTLNLTKNRQK